LKDEGKTDKKQSTLPFPARSAAELKHLRHELQEILQLLSPRR
jgi:hypothetical protein